MHYFGIITTLPFSKYASPIFAQRKPNGRLRLLVDLRKINNLISDDYINNNHPVSTLTDAAQHLAGKKLFCKLDCSQAYHVLQMADQKSVQLLAFNFASKTFAYLRLAQGLSRSLSSFSSFMREYLDKAIKADKCAQYVDDIGIATNTPEELKNNLREVFQCIRAAGLRLTMAKCQFGAKEVEFLGRTISPAGVAPQSHKIQKHLQTIKFPRTKKGLQRYIGFVNYYRNYIPRLSEKIAPFHELIKSDKPVKIDQDLISNFEAINKSLDNACGLWLKQPLPNRQYVLMTDASFKNAGYALMTEEDPEQKITSTKKTYAPVAFGSKTFSPSQLKMSIYAKEFLAIYFAFMEYSHILWGSSKPTIVLTDNKSVTRFFQTKMIPPSLWNACDFVLQFHFKIAHVPGRMNTAADFLSRLDISPKEKVLLQIREDIQTTPIQVNIQSSDIHEEDQFYFLPEDDSETEEDIWERKQQARKQIYSPYQKSTDPMNETDQTISQPENLPLVCNNIQDPEQEQRRLLHNDTSFSRSLRPHQDQDPVLRNLKLKILKEPYDTQLLNDDPRAAKYLTQDDRIIIKDGLLYRQYFGDTGKVKYLQVLLPQQLVDEFIQYHHGKFGKHPGIAKTIQQCREKYYFPGLAARIATHITQCPECAQTKRTPNANITPPLIDMSKVALGPEDALQMDIVPFDDPSGGYNAVITAMDVFSRYLFAYSVARVDTKTVTRVLTDIITRHCYLPTTIITDKGSQFISEAMQQTTAVLGIQLKHATTKHAQTIGILERTHASLKESLKIMTGERRTMWHQFLPMAVLNYNTSYHTSLGCEPSRVFHGRVPYNVLDLKYGIKPQASSTINHEIAEGVLKQTQQILNNSQQALMQAYVRHKRYYDRKASAHPLVVNDYCYALHPKAHSQATKLPFREYLWTGPYIVVKTLPNNNYLIRKLQTNFTQILHRIRLRPFASSQKLPDITVPPKDYQQDTEVTIQVITSSFMREYLDKAIKADKCAQYVDDIGIATNTPEELKNNLREVFQCIRAAGLRLTMAKCQFGAKEVEFLGRTISPAGVAPQSHKIQKHLQTIKFPRTKKGLQRYIGFVNYYRNYIPRLSEKIAPFHELIKSDKPVKIDQDLISNFEAINKSLDNACGLWLKQPLPNRQYVLMTDASFKNAGYALMTEEDPEQKITSTKKTYAPVAFGSKTFSPSQLKMSIYAKEFLAIYFAFMEYSHILWGSSKPTIVLTDNKSVTRFFQTKMIPPSLWNACDFVLQFHFKIAHVPGRMNTAADFLSRLDISPKEKVLLQIREDIQTTPIQVNIQSSDIHEEDQFYFLPEDDSETEEDIWERKQQARKQIYSPYQKSTDPMNETDQTISQPENLPLVCNNIQDPEQEQRRLLHNDTSFSRSLRPHQDQDPVLRNLKLKILKEPYDTQLLNDDPRAAKYLTQDDRIIIKDGLLYRQYFGDTGKVKYLQVLLPQQLVDEFIQYHHGKFGKHPGIAKTIQQCREKYYFPGLAARIATHITQCPECAQTKRTPNANITPPLIDMSKVALGPEDALQMDIVPFDDPSGGYNAVITAMDVFSRYLFAYSVARVDTKTVTRVLTDIITRHCYLPTTIITDKGSQFISEAMQQTTAVLGIQLKHATTKHAQTIGILERTHASLKESLKIMTGERRTMWHQFLPMAVLNYNTSYHTSLGCEPSRVFHGRVPYNVLDLKYGIKPQASSTINHEIAEGVLKQTQQILNNSQQALMQAYVRHKRYYDRKASAHPLVVNDYCYALHPKAHSQATKLPFREYLWTGPYIVVKTLPNNNYLIRKLQTNFTQILHRIRLRPFASSQKLPDITVPPKDYQQDTEVTIQHDDLFAMAWEELYNECPPQPENKQSPEPEITLPTPVTDNAPTHPEPPSPNLAYEPEPTPTYPSDQTQDPTVDLDDIPEENTDTHKSPRKSQYNLRRNPTSNWKPDYAYYNALTANSTNPAQSTGSLDDDPEFQVLADLGPDGSPRSEN